MVEIGVSPSDLHLKKELTALQKARVLRDPGTHTSWKSPLRSNSLGTSVNLNSANDNSKIQRAANNSSGSFEPISGFEKRKKKVHLYNWGNNSSKSSDSLLQLDEDSNRASAQSSPQEDLNTTLRMESANDGVKGRKPVRTAIKPNRARRINENSERGHNSAELSDASGYYCSQEFQQSKYFRQSKYMPAGKHSCYLHCESPLTPGSGCGNWSKSTILKSYRRREGCSRSYTPSTNCSCSRRGARNLSIGGSWDRLSASSDGDVSPHLRRNQGCSLPFYWSKEAKETGFKSCSSSDKPNNIVRSILYGSHTLHSKRSSSGSQKQEYTPKSSQSGALLTNRFDVVDSSTDLATDEIATTIGEIDLEAMNRLDGRRWSLPKGFDSEMVEQKSLSHMYRPRSFDEIVGHDTVVQSLNNAILRGKIAPAYLFQGPHGTGKTSSARIFAAALNCMSTDENRPCRLCSECSNFSSGNVSNFKEVDATNKKDIGRVRLLLKKMAIGKTFSRYQVFIVDECHMLSSKSWSEFMIFLEEPLPYVVFIFITTNPDILPRAVVSRCQRYHFPKIKDSNITLRLRKISAEENLDVELDALDLIALNSDGSLHNAETTLDQLSLLGKRISTALVNDLVGLVSNERLLDLLELALSSNTVETIKKSRELIESGVDPVILTSQLAGLIMDIIAGTSQLPSSHFSGFGAQSLTEAEVGRLQQALKFLSDAEKQLRYSSERSTLFIAALLQLNSGPSLQPSPSRSSSRQSTERLDEDSVKRIQKTWFTDTKPGPSFRLHELISAASPRVSSGRYSIYAPRRSLNNNHEEYATNKSISKCASRNMLDRIWRQCIEGFDSERHRHFLYDHGKLVSISESRDGLIAYIAFGDDSIKSRAERHLNNITDSLRAVLRHNVEVRIGLVPEKYLKSMKSMPNSPSIQPTDIIEYLDKVGKKETGYTFSSEIPRKSTDYSDSKPQAILEKDDVHLHKANTTSIHEQRLESAWLQAAGRGEAPKHGNNYVRRNGAGSRNESRSPADRSISFKNWDDGQGDEIRERHVNGRHERYRGAISPSLLHSNSFKTNVDQASLGSESGSAQTGFCCWKSKKPPTGKVKRGNNVRSQKLT